MKIPTVRRTNFVNASISMRLPTKNSGNDSSVNPPISFFIITSFSISIATSLLSMSAKCLPYIAMSHGHIHELMILMLSCVLRLSNCNGGEVVTRAAVTLTRCGGGCSDCTQHVRKWIIWYLAGSLTRLPGSHFWLEQLRLVPPRFWPLSLRARA